MKRAILIALTLATTFLLGFAFKSVTKINDNKMKRVTGIGGVFFKCKDPNAIKEWYKTHLGLETDQWGTNFEWRHGKLHDSTNHGYNLFRESTINK